MEFALIVLVVVVGLGVWGSKNKAKLDAWTKEAEEKKKAAQEKRNYQRTLQGKPRKQTLDDEIGAMQHMGAKGKAPSPPATVRQTMRVTRVSKKPFEFPAFPYDDTTMVRIKDTTNYRQDFIALSYDPENYGWSDFEHDLAPYSLDIEVDGFECMFKDKSTSAIGFEKLPKKFADFYTDIVYRLQGDSDPMLIIDDQIKRTLLKSGVLESFEIERTEENIGNYLEGMTLVELKEECGRLGIKKTQNKSALIHDLLTLKDQLNIKPMAKLSCAYFDLIEKLGEAYILDIEAQLIDKPDAYAAAVWDLVISDHGDELPASALDRAKKNFERVEHLMEAVA